MKKLFSIIFSSVILILPLSASAILAEPKGEVPRVEPLQAPPSYVKPNVSGNINDSEQSRAAAATDNSVSSDSSSDRVLPPLPTLTPTEPYNPEALPPSTFDRWWVVVV